MKAFEFVIVCSAIVALFACTTTGAKKDRSEWPVFHHMGRMDR